MIVCRNVLIYFTEEAKHDVYVKFENPLKNMVFYLLEVQNR